MPDVPETKPPDRGNLSRVSEYDVHRVDGSDAS